ncbi:MAG: peptidoglycan LD-endopeptidase LytH [Actinomycetota bacterium]|jgi:murein DD-endopeptidase MepM/ murein hydrolase activator NlpD|nr:peptidoglycan LD-endopeptidase LytH [Actinomycetota bacterium]
MHQRRVAAVVAALLVVGFAPFGARAQSNPPSTVLPPASTTTTTAKPGPATTTTAPPQGDPNAPPAQPDEDTGPVEVPQQQVEIPPADPAAPPDPTAPILQQITGLTLAEASKGLRDAEAAHLFAATQASTLGSEVADLEARLTRLEAEKAQAVARLQQARLQLKKRAVAGYMGSPAASINRVLDAADFNDLSRRFELMQSVVESDRARIDEYQAAREAVGNELDGVVATLDAKRSALLVASTVLDGADSALLAKQIQVAAVKAGGAVIGGGFVFPVGGQHSFTDTFGAPRMFGTAYAHLHQGTDIFAASGTPLLAVERGVVIQMGSDVLGGTKLWLVGASGTRYYYAHLSAFAEGMAENTLVKAGDVVGFVGNTGNAATTPAHLHFEVHPGGGPAVNPYPLLKIVDDAQKKLMASQPPQQQPPPSSGPKS